jgi:multidrug transporter EmrE-like cation transporter
VANPSLEDSDLSPAQRNPGRSMAGLLDIVWASALTDSAGFTRLVLSDVSIALLALALTSQRRTTAARSGSVASSNWRLVNEQVETGCGAAGIAMAISHRD